MSMGGGGGSVRELNVSRVLVRGVCGGGGG